MEAFTDYVSYAVFSPWLSRQEREGAQKHSKENFVYILYREKDSEREFTGRLNLKTKEVMWIDPEWIITSKCFVIGFVGNPAEIFCRNCLSVKKLALMSLENLTCASFSPFRLVKDTASACFDILRTTFYGAGISLAAIGGAFVDPLRARSRIGLIAKHLNYDVSYHDYRHLPYDSEFPLCYLAPCMQPLVYNFDKKDWEILSESKTLSELLKKTE